MAKGKITKASKMRLIYVGVPSLFCIIGFFIVFSYNMYSLYYYTKEKKSLENEYLKLQEEAEEFRIDIEKLSDPEYLANYARENYLYSKGGEYIIQMESELSDDIEETDNTIKRNYIFVILCVIIMFIFIYIITKEKKSKK